MATDRIGNKLAKGDLASAMIPSQRDPAVLAEIFGEIVDIREGGLTLGKSGNVTPGEIVLHVQVTMPFDSKTGEVFGLIKLHDPSRKTGLLQ